MNLSTGRRPVRAVAAIVIVSVVSFAIGDQTERKPAEPERVDERIEPTINPKRPGYETLEERVALIEAANKLRNERLTKYPTPVSTCRRVEDGAIEVDGKLDDAAWGRAAVMPNFRDTRAGEPAKFKTD